MESIRITSFIYAKKFLPSDLEYLLVQKSLSSQRMEIIGPSSCTKLVSEEVITSYPIPQARTKPSNYLGSVVEQGFIKDIDNLIEITDPCV